MRILAVDTANNTCSAALWEDGAIVSFMHDPTPSRQAESLFPLIAIVLGERGYGGLDALAVSIGPGSFTGIRIGLAAMRGIAVAAELPVLGVTTLEAVAWQAVEAGASNPVLVALDARRGALYTQLFSSDLQPRAEASLVDYADIMLPTGKFTLAGNGAAMVKPLLEGHSEVIFSQAQNLPDAASVAAMAARKLHLGEAAPSLPFYIRQPDAKPQKPRLF